ncbi:hypothetical protein ARNL5_00364 [Anaerolineae bacterium]|uniref:nucleotidyltransferase domain-containing protein n=1 Tax=Geobacter sp. TaxID=46610 RepID=UPI001ACB14DE|nr:nucleotidyltransferase domain-containing protein [Geobacter sp.]CAG0954231.1 hypothetical protein ARNL5_00364 [Anaerolineae bacterium]
MRIEQEELDAIVNSIARFDRKSEIYLFGSRLDDSKRGGDIDILIASEVISSSLLAHIEDKIFSLIDEQKIDFVLTRKSQPSAFARMILAKGVRKLC